MGAHAWAFTLLLRNRCQSASVVRRFASLFPVPIEVVLVTELFPPDVGGSAELFGNIYSRLGDTAVAVVAQRRATPPRPLSIQRIVELDMSLGRWGVAHPAALAGHLRVAGAIRRLSRGADTGIHCGRILPEGLSALMARASGASPYACWVHGEELGYIDGSRELRALGRAVVKGCRALIANSQNTATLLRQRGVPSERIHIVRPGVHVASFQPRPRDADALRHELAPNGEHVLLTVGRLQRRKGHDLVLEALAGLDAARLRTVRYVIVGEGEERARLEQLVAARQLERQVSFRGRAEAADLPRYYAAADLFVHPNRAIGGDIEGFGIVFLEAAASGLCAIGGRNGGVPEAVEDQVTGWLVRGDDADELRGAIVTLLDDERRRKTLGDAALARVRREFTWDRAASEVATVHQELFVRGARPRGSA